MNESPFSLQSLSETEALAQKIARLALLQDVILLKGELGAGKTELARRIIRTLNPDITHVPSPTFTLVQTYETEKGTLWHFDLYRLRSSQEVFELGFEDALSAGISLIEWPERLENLSVPSYLEITLKNARDSEVREVSLRMSESWERRWKQESF